MEINKIFAKPFEICNYYYLSQVVVVLPVDGFGVSGLKSPCFSVEDPANNATFYCISLFQTAALGINARI